MGYIIIGEMSSVESDENYNRREKNSDENWDQ